MNPLSYKQVLRRLPVVLTLLCFPLLSAQVTASKRLSIAEQAAKQVAELNASFASLLTDSPADKELAAACAVDCSPPQVKAGLRDLEAKRTAALTAMDAVVAKIHAQVDFYITHTVEPKHIDLDKTTVKRDLKRILSPAIGDYTPSAFVLQAQGPSLVVAYTLYKEHFMGLGATSVSLRAYRATASGLKFASSTGDDMAGYGGTSFTRLPSPVPEQIWLLANGQMTGANGPNIRMRIYVFDGARFRTVWMPENVWGSFTIGLTAHGFTVDGPYYREPGERHSRYFLAPDGITRVQR